MSYLVAPALADQLTVIDLSAPAVSSTSPGGAGIVHVAAVLAGRNRSCPGQSPGFAAITSTNAALMPPSRRSALFMRTPVASRPAPATSRQRRSDIMPGQHARMNGKVCVVTGATSGIGTAAATALASRRAGPPGAEGPPERRGQPGRALR